MPSRRLDRGHDRGRVVVRREQLEAHRLRALAAGAAEQPVALEGLLEPAVEDQPERDVERDDERRRRREGRVELLLRAARAVPVEVVARRRGASLGRPDGVRDGGHGQAGRRHQRLLRAGAGDVDPPGVHLERDGAEARDRVDDDVRAARAHGCRERLDVGDDARSTSRTGSGRRPATSLASRERRGQVVGGRRLAPLVARRPDLAAVALGELRSSARRSCPRRRRRPGCPGEQRFATADSIAPVPEAVKRSTSDEVRKTCLQPLQALARRSARKSEPRWWTTGSASAASTSGGTVVGPGVNR